MKVHDIGKTLPHRSFPAHGLDGKILNWEAKVPHDKGMPYYGVLFDRDKGKVYRLVQPAGIWAYQETITADLKR